MSCSESHFYCCSADPIMVMYGLGDLAFRIVEHIVFSDNGQLNLVQESPEEIEYRTLENKSHDLAEYLHNSDFLKSGYIKLELKGGGFFEFATGELHLNYPDGMSAKDSAEKILNAYGYFGSSEIWRLMRHNEGLMFDIDDCFLLQSFKATKQTVDKFIVNDTIAKWQKQRDEEEY
jgi:hypothetical protein